MKKKLIKIIVGFIIFMILVYPLIVIKKCLTYEEKMNECQKIYEWGFFIISKRALEIFYKILRNINSILWYTVHRYTIVLKNDLEE